MAQRKQEYRQPTPPGKSRPSCLHAWARAPAGLGCVGYLIIRAIGCLSLLFVIEIHSRAVHMLAVSEASQPRLTIKWIQRGAETCARVEVNPIR
jgi:hypothetical protein